MDQKTLKKSKKTIELGTFEIVSGVVRISDPCYDKKTWCAGKITDVLNGTWKAQVIKKSEEYEYVGEVQDWAKGKTFHNHRNVLIAVHSTFDKSIHTDKRKITEFHGGMDAGMAGIFDNKFYQKNYKEDYIKFGEEEYHTTQRKYRDQEFASLRPPSHKYVEPSQESQDKMMLAILKGELSRLPKSIEENKNRKGFEKFAVRDARRLKEIKQRIARYEANPIHENIIERTRDWYEICCDKSLSNVGAGVIRNGVVSSSGYGDGGYDVFTIANSDGLIVGIKLRF